MKSVRLRATACIAGLVLWATTGSLCQATDHVVLGLDWQALGRHAGFFVAKEKGFYKQEGLDVDILRGYGAADAVKRLAGGDTTIAFGDFGSLILARAQGIKVKAVAMIYARCPYVLWTRGGERIDSPKDLPGKTIGAPAGASVRLLFPAFASKVGLDENEVKWVTVDAAGLYPLLFTDRVDAVVDYEFGWPTISQRAQEAGLKVGKLRFSDYGFDIYSNAIITTDEMIEKNPDLVRRFVKASLKGFEAAFSDPAAAGETMKTAFPILDATAAQQEVEITRTLAIPETGELGFISKEKAETTRDIVKKAYAIKVDVPVADTYTDEFLPKATQ
jgi:NitT/TauT family transport system substrate-binding protein